MKPGVFHALVCPITFADRACAALLRRDRLGAIAIQLSVVRQGVQTGRRRNVVLFHQLPAVYDDDLRRRRLLLSEPVLPCGAG